MQFDIFCDDEDKVIGLVVIENDSIKDAYLHPTITPNESGTIYRGNPNIDIKEIIEECSLVQVPPYRVKTFGYMYKGDEDEFSAND